MASGKMHGRLVEGVSKLLGRPCRPGDGGTSLASEGASLPFRQAWTARPVCAKENHGTIVPGAPRNATAPAGDRQPWEIGQELFSSPAQARSSRPTWSISPRLEGTSSTCCNLSIR